MAASCPRLTVRKTAHATSFRWTQFDAYQAGAKVGQLMLRERTLRGDFQRFYVSHVKVTEAARRCGVGTRLYEVAARHACQLYRSPLTSDIERSAAAQAFWDKQLRKGRASCAAPAEPYRGSESTPVAGRGGCEYYTLRCPAPRTLARVD